MIRVLNVSNEPRL